MNQFFCPYCGKPVEATDTFCAECGGAVSGGAVPAGAGKKSGGKKRLVVALSIVLGVLLVAGGVLAFFRLSDFGSPQLMHSIQDALVDGGGNAYLVKDGGSLVTLDDEIHEAYMTPDQERIFALTEDGELYMVENGKETDIAEDVYTILTLTDNMVYYCMNRSVSGQYLLPEDELPDIPYESEYYLYWTESGITAELGVDVHCAISSQGDFVAYSVREGDEVVLYRLEKDCEEPEELDSRDTGITVCGVADRTGAVVYCVLGDTNEDSRVMLYSGDDSEKLFTTDGGVSSVNFNAEGTFGVISNLSGEELVIWTERNGVENLRFPDANGFGLPNTDQGSMRLYPDVTPSEIYIPVYTEDSECDLYCVTPEGDKDKLLSGIDSYSVSDNALYYIKDDTLRYASIKKGELGEDERVAKNVSRFKTSPTGTVTFLTNDDALFYYEPGMDESAEICGDDCTGFYFTADGKAVYYWKSVESDYGTGTLMRYSVSKDDSERIARNAKYSVLERCTKYRGNYIDDRDMNFLVLTDEDDGYTYWDLVHWDGSKTRTLLKEYPKAKAQ